MASSVKNQEIVTKRGQPIAPDASVSYVTRVTSPAKLPNPVGRRAATLFRLVLVQAFAAAVFLAFNSAQAQNLRVRVIVNGTSQVARVEGTYRPALAHWSFSNSYGRVTGLAARIHKFQPLDDNDKAIAVRPAGPGEFIAERVASGFSYEVVLTPPANANDAAHTSWLTGEQGLLMLADLLPAVPASGLHVEFELPANWRLASSAVQSARGGFDVPSREGAVFFVGSDLKEKRKRRGASEITLVTRGEWGFSSDAAANMAIKILEDHSRSTGFSLRTPIMIMLAPCPVATDKQGWSAETRGSNVVLLVGQSSALKFSLSQLSVVLCHELFHLWVPNKLALEGDFDWFFEGGTLYQALRTAIRLKLINFQEYLDTLGRVYDSYLLSPGHGALSLIEASQRRWTSGSSLVYDEGMLVAFILDLKLRKAASGQLSIDSVYQRLFHQFATAENAVDGNDAILSILGDLTGDSQFATRYVLAPFAIDMDQIIPEYGLRVALIGGKRRFQVAPQPNREQSKVLKALGYRETGR